MGSAIQRAAEPIPAPIAALADAAQDGFRPCRSIASRLAARWVATARQTWLPSVSRGFWRSGSSSTTGSGRHLGGGGVPAALGLSLRKGWFRIDRPQ